MKPNLTQKQAASGSNEDTTATAQADRLLTFRGVYELTGNACKTGHAALRLARAGKIRAVRINERVIRYSESSVRALVAGRVAK
ncbi:hypothetical protein IMCC26134_12875 [Verrucomicrobia bacterium IMCC26134]|nr:hypothetical protein IMCC26134_12875 [Verrucomicrobia bacterium IMCC26134]